MNALVWSGFASQHISCANVASPQKYDEASTCEPFNRKSLSTKFHMKHQIKDTGKQYFGPLKKRQGGHNSNRRKIKTFTGAYLTVGVYNRQGTVK